MAILSFRKELLMNLFFLPHSLKSLTTVALSIMFLSCSSIRHVVPLKQGESRISVSIGGPVTKIGESFIPLPFVTAGYNYGLKYNLDIESGINITSLFFGITNIDAGINWHPVVPLLMRPGMYVSLKGVITTNFEKNGTRLFPVNDLGIYWLLFKHQYIYSGIESWVELHDVRYDGNIQKNHLLINPYIGYILEYKTWQYQLEGRVYTPNIPNKGRAVKNKGMGDYGIFGFFLGVSKSFGGK
jgi:hypothetical protein